MVRFRAKHSEQVRRTQGERGDAGDQVLRNDPNLVAHCAAQAGGVCREAPGDGAAGVLVDVEPAHLLRASPLHRPASAVSSDGVS
jgi:hypothetical protein